jgi:hypothetical protein
LISLSREGLYVGQKNTVFWDVFTAVSMIAFFWDFVPMSIPEDLFFGPT